MLCLYPDSSVAQTPIGYVLEIEGSWHVNNDFNNTLTLGGKLPASGVISVRSPSRSDRIVIANMRGKIIAARHCAIQDCTRNFTLPQRAPLRSAANVLFRTAMDLIWGAPARYSFHRSRNSPLPDGLAKLEGQALDLSQLLTEQRQYHIRWREVPPAGAAEGVWSQTMMVEVREGSPAYIHVKDVKPGLYEFSLLRPLEGRLVSDGSSSFVLVLPPTKFAKALASFRQATKTTEGWGDKIKPETAQLFLRAYLDGLAQEETKRVR